MPAARLQPPAEPRSSYPDETAQLVMPSDEVNLSCEDAPCPWGARVTRHAIAWPLAAGPVRKRLGYEASLGMYLPAARANGSRVALKSGTATAYAGAPDAREHRTLAALKAGEALDVAGLAPGEVLSVQSDEEFTYVAYLKQVKANTGARSDGEVIGAVSARWRCVEPDCNTRDWVGAVIPWPESAAYQGNGRAGVEGRLVFTPDGQPLYPYMGAWADGCEVTAHSGDVLIVEWERGSDKWRETPLEPGETYTIRLEPPENGAMIETVEGGVPFSVSLENCHPKPLTETSEEGMLEERSDAESSEGSRPE